MSENTDSLELFPIDLNDDSNLSSDFIACLDSAANFATQDLTSTEIEVFNKLVNPDILMDQPALNVEQNVNGQQLSSSSLLGNNFTGQQKDSSSLLSNNFIGPQPSSTSSPSSTMFSNQQQIKGSFRYPSSNFYAQRQSSFALPSNKFDGSQQFSSSFPSNNYIDPQTSTFLLPGNNFIQQQQSSFASSRSVSISNGSRSKMLSVHKSSTMVQKYNIVPRNQHGKHCEVMLPKMAQHNDDYSAQNSLAKPAGDFSNQKSGYDEMFSVRRKTATFKQISIVPENTHGRPGNVKPSQSAQQTNVMDQQLKIHPINSSSEYGDLIPFQIAQHNDTSVPQEHADGKLSVVPAESTLNLAQLDSETKAVTVQKRRRKRGSKYNNHREFRFKNSL